MRLTGPMQTTTASDSRPDLPGAGISISGPDSRAQRSRDGSVEPYGPTAASMAETNILRLEVANYITQMSAELSAMARSSEFALLSYFLDMAAAEARESAGKLCHAIGDDGPDEPQSRKSDQTLT